MKLFEEKRTLLEERGAFIIRLMKFPISIGMLHWFTNIFTFLLQTIVYSVECRVNLSNIC